MRQLNGYGSAALGERVKLSLNANYSDADGYFRVAPRLRGAIDRKPSAKNLSMHGKAEFQLSDKSTGYLLGNFYSQDQQLDSKLNQTTTDVLHLTAGLRTQLGSAGVLRANLFFGDEEFTTDNTSLVNDSRDGEFVSNAHVTPSTDVGGALQWSNSFAHNRASVSLGVDARFINGKDDADIFLEDGTLFLNRIGKGKQRSVGIFGEVSYFPVTALEIAASLRQDFFSNFDGKDISNDVTTTFEEKNFNELNPKLAVRYQAAEQVGIKSSVYTAFRAPTLAELYRAFGTSDFIGLPNAELEPEHLKGVEGGVEIAAGRFFGQINGYYCEVEDLVTGVVVDFDPFTLFNSNIGKIRSQGFEVIADFGVTEELLLSAGYTYVDAEVTENQDDPGLVGNKVEGSPENTFTFGMTYRRPDGIKFAVRGRFLDDMFQDISNETALPSHSVFDASVSYPIGKSLEVFTVGENIFDEEYIASGFGGLEIFGAPRQVFAGIRLGFNPK
jgi:outer membrane receptor protein involved in Fe transport